MRRMPKREPSETTVVYDGLCHLCSGSVAWIARRLDDGVRFVPVQSGEGADALKAAGLDALDPASFLVVSDCRSLQKSAAIIAVLDVCLAAAGSRRRCCFACCRDQSRTKSMTGSQRTDTSGLASAPPALSRARAVSPISCP
jgi:predicted DCC family thiol-disulfide oxidoreductase YuxK